MTNMDRLEGIVARLPEWVRTAYALVAPKRLARAVLGEDG